jgi:hypothetical protein
MTRDAVRALGLTPAREFKDGSGIFFPMPLLRADGGASEGVLTGPDAREGVTAHFDPSGRCVRIEAFFASGPPLFRLRGRIVNGLAADTVEEILREVSDDIRHGYGSMTAPAAGISGVKWERDDLCLCAIDVFPSSAP